ncbi:unnamed protein product, partial [Rotaria sp. Silwood1]
MCLKKPVSINELTQASRPLRNILDQIRVRCTLCAETGLQRGNFVDHINKICPKSVVPCQAADIKCRWKGPRDELQSHISTCVFEPLRPNKKFRYTSGTKNVPHQLIPLNTK